MTLLIFRTGLGNLNDPFDLIDFGSLVFTEKTETSAFLQDPTGAGIQLTGTGFSYSGSTLITGAVQTVTMFGEGGVETVSFQDVGLDVPLAGLELGPALGHFGHTLLAGDDTIRGSTNQDVMIGFAGHDTLRGFAGRDVLFASNGRDWLFGGAGRDEFAFRPNTGVDRIADFADDDLPSDDVILVRKALYDQMTVTQSGASVLLQFGTKGTMLILNSQAVDIGADDFSVFI